MDDYFYKRIVDHLQIGYAYHKIIYSEYGSPCDFEFLEVNLAFEKLQEFRKVLNDTLNVTISGCFEKYHGDLDDALKKADELLYKAMEDGRNKVIHAY